MDKIIVFGRGNVFRKKEETIRKHYVISAFLDSSIIEKEYDQTYECPVLPLDYVNSTSERILITSLDFVNMWQQLMCLGVEENRVLFACNLLPHYRGLEEMAFSQGEYLACKKGSLIYVTKSGEHAFSKTEEFRVLLQGHVRNQNKCISDIANLPVRPVSRVFGSERGKAVDRYYIESFLSKNEEDIRGICLEVGGDAYINKYGKGKVEKKILTHVRGDGGLQRVNFETGEGVENELVDCIICTQTLQYIHDVKNAIYNIYRMLKVNGVALITVPGIKGLCLSDAELWGERWSFTTTVLSELIDEVLTANDRGEYEVESYGNVKIATAYLYGLCCEDIDENDFEYNDDQYPFLITAKIIRKA